MPKMIDIARATCRPEEYIASRRVIRWTSADCSTARGEGLPVATGRALADETLGAASGEPKGVDRGESTLSLSSPDHHPHTHRLSSSVILPA
jgi:hypothetical protein